METKEQTNQETKQETITMRLFAKKEKSKDGNEYYRYFSRYDDSNIKLSINTNLTNDAKSKVQLSKLSYPLRIVLTDGKDYFFSTEKYEDKNGITCYGDVLVIKDFTSMEHLELPNKTLREYYNEKIGKYLDEEK